jgi:hypothetical protein
MSTVADVYQNRFLENWQEITTIRKPIIAAVSGFAVKPTVPFLFPPLPSDTARDVSLP